MRAISLRHPRISHRRFADLLLFAVTLAELTILLFLTPAFTAIDWVYVSGHLVVLGIALTRRVPLIQDQSLSSNIAVGVSYTYPYAQVIYLQWMPGISVLPMVGLILVTVSAGVGFASVLTLGRQFGIRPALRGLVTNGPYKLVRHPLYLSYIASDIGYNLQEWNFGTLLLVLAGWFALVWRIRAEERVLSQAAEWPNYEIRVRYRLVPGIW
jgi:protein-S-isoprenylcysteine O-methyltransferase Ste14